MQKNQNAQTQSEQLYSDLFFQRVIQAYINNLIKRQSAIVIFQVLQGTLQKMSKILSIPPSREIAKLACFMMPTHDYQMQLQQFKKLCKNKHFIIELGHILTFAVYHFLIEQLKQTPRESDIINSTADFLSIDITIYNADTYRSIDYQAQGPFIQNVYQRDAYISLKRKGNNFLIYQEDQKKANFYPLLDSQPKVSGIKIKFDLFKKIAHSFGITLQEPNQRPLLETLMLEDDHIQLNFQSSDIEPDSAFDIINSKILPSGSEIPDEYNGGNQKPQPIFVEPPKPKKLPAPKEKVKKNEYVEEDRSQIQKLIESSQFKIMNLSQSQLKSKTQQFICLKTCMDSIEKNSYLWAMQQYFDTNNADGLFKESSNYSYIESEVNSPKCPQCNERLNVDDLSDLFPHLLKSDIAKAFNSRINIELDKNPKPNQAYINKIIHYKVLTASPLLQADFLIQINKPKDEMIRKKIKLEEKLGGYMKKDKKTFKIENLKADFLESMRLIQGFAKLQSSINIYSSQHNRGQLERAMSSLIRINFYLDMLITSMG